MFFIFPSGPSASFANCQLTSVDSCNWRLPPTHSQHAVLVFCLLPPLLPPPPPPPLLPPSLLLPPPPLPVPCCLHRAACAKLPPPTPSLSTVSPPSSSSAATVCSPHDCLQSLSAPDVSAAASTGIHTLSSLSSQALVHSHRQPLLSVVAASATTNVLHSAQPLFSTVAAVSVRRLPLLVYHQK